MTKYCYSFDEELFDGDCDSIEEALEEATEEAEQDGHIVCWIAEVVSAKDYLRAAWVGEHVHEKVDESLYDDIGGDDPALAMSQEQHAELGQIIIDWLDKSGCFARHGVANSVKHDIPQEGA